MIIQKFEEGVTWLFGLVPGFGVVAIYRELDVEQVDVTRERILHVILCQRQCFILVLLWSFKDDFIVNLHQEFVPKRFKLRATLDLKHG